MWTSTSAKQVYKNEWIFDQTTLQFIGERIFNPKTGQVTGESAILQQAFTAKAGQRPVASGTRTTGGGPPRGPNVSTADTPAPYRGVGPEARAEHVRRMDRAVLSRHDSGRRGGAVTTPPLPGFLNSLAGPLDHYGLWAVLLFVMIEDFGIPVPGEAILIAASVYAGTGRLNIVAVAVVGFIAAVTGDNIGFAIGHFGGRALALRWGHYVFLTEERLDKAAGFFDRHGAWIITVARFIEGLRQANGIVAGITGMRWLRFLVFNALGAALWVGTWVSVGYLAGSHIDSIYSYITRYSYYALIAAGVVIVALVARHLLRRRRARQQPAPGLARDADRRE